MTTAKAAFRIAQLTALLIFSAGSAWAQNAAPTSPPDTVRHVGELRLGVSLDRTIAGGQTDVFTVQAKAGDYLHVIADQKGVDVVVAIVSPSGQSLVVADTITGNYGPELASAICDEDSTYQVRVTAANKGPEGHYIARLESLRPSEVSDSLRIEAETELFTETKLVRSGRKEEVTNEVALLEAAIGVWKTLGDKYELGYSLRALGEVYDGSSDSQKAVQYYGQALPILRAAGDRNNEASIHEMLGRIYMNSGQNQMALDNLIEALPIQREAGDRSSEANTLVLIGAVFGNMGQLEKELTYYDQGLSIFRELGLTDEEAQTVEAIAIVYRELGQKQKALEYLKSLPVSSKIASHSTEAITLTDIGEIYNDLGQSQDALVYFERALVIERQFRKRFPESNTLVQIGQVHADLGDKQKAVEYFIKALSIQDELDLRFLEPSTLNSIGRSYSDLDQKQKALEYLEKAIPLEHSIGDSFGEIVTHLFIGDIYSRLGRSHEALAENVKALSLAKITGSLKLQGAVEATLMAYFHHLGKPVIAIPFGTESVNFYQQVRTGALGLDKESQIGLAKSFSATYRELADLLVSQNRLAEAERVLDLLKDAELKETVRGAREAADTKTAQLPLSSADHDIEVALSKQSLSAADLTVASFEFDRLSALASPTPADKAKLTELSAKIAAGNAAMETFFNKTLYNELGGAKAANARVNDASTETSSLMNMLADLGPDVIALYTLIGEQHSYIIVTTANTRVRREIHANAADIGKLVLATRQQLVSQTGNPSANLMRLDHLLLDPIADDIAAAAKQSKDGVPTLLWSLDGVLRYLPMNALYDGKQYLVERARNVIVTPESRNHLLDAASTKGLTAVALGLSKSYNGNDALEGVTAELNAVVRDPAAKDSHGPLSGKLVSNDNFTLAAFEENLHQHYPVVHVASHFAFRYGDAGESYLLLSGDQTGGPGYALTLSQLQTDPKLSFRGTRLLTLSACGTAQAGISSNGREIDSLGMVVQKRDAASVLATLWSVNDASTSLLMSDFYRRWAAPSGIEKVEALRQSQMAMLRDKNYAHPYFWAPFVLIGNFR